MYFLAGSVMLLSPVPVDCCAGAGLLSPVALSDLVVDIGAVTMVRRS